MLVSSNKSKMMYFNNVDSSDSFFPTSDGGGEKPRGHEAIASHNIKLSTNAASRVSGTVRL